MDNHKIIDETVEKYCLCRERFRRKYCKITEYDARKELRRRYDDRAEHIVREGAKALTERNPDVPHGEWVEAIYEGIDHAMDDFFFYLDVIEVKSPEQW